MTSIRLALFCFGYEPQYQHILSCADGLSTLIYYSEKGKRKKETTKTTFSKVKKIKKQRGKKTDNSRELSLSAA